MLESNAFGMFNQRLNMTKRTGPTNMHMQSLIADLTRESYQQKTPIWHCMRRNASLPLGCLYGSIPLIALRTNRSGSRGKKGPLVG